MAASAAAESCVFGLKYPARCIAAQAAETDRTRFFVATEGLSDDNEVRLLDFDEDEFEITTQTFPHPHEVCSIAPSLNRADLLITTYRTGHSTHTSLWMLSALSTSDSGKLLNQSGNLGELLSVESPSTDDIKRALWEPHGRGSRILGVGGNVFCLYSLDSGMSTAKMENEVKASALGAQYGAERIECAKWDPINPDDLVFGVGSNLVGWDLRANKKTYSVNKAHSICVRDVDYNRNKSHHIATCGDDGKIRIWDNRKASGTAGPLMEISEHSHWVWSVSFNLFHDQLLLSASSDCVVNLHNAGSVSSAPHGLVVDDEDEMEEGSTEFKRDPVDGLAATFREFEDSVYCTAWSAADPWIFGSVSFDGRVLINMVPRDVKYSIIL